MTIVALMLAHDDEDIIESSIRHNLNFVDAVFAVGLDSRDGTRSIVENVASEGHPVAFNPAGDQIFPSAYLAGTLRELASQTAIRHVVPLAADTFIEGKPALFRDTLLGDPFSVFLLPRSVRVPTEADDWSQPDPYRRLVYKRLFEIDQRSVAVLPQRLFADVPVNPDGLYREDDLENARVMDGVAAVQLPVRNAWQFAGAITARVRDIMRAAEDGIGDRPERVDYWKRMAGLMQERALMSRAALRSAAAEYESFDPLPLVEDAPEILCDHAIRYPAEAALELDHAEEFIGSLNRSRVEAAAGSDGARA